MKIRVKTLEQLMNTPDTNYYPEYYRVEKGIQLFNIKYMGKYIGKIIEVKCIRDTFEGYKYVHKEDAGYRDWFFSDWMVSEVIHDS